MTRLTIAAFAVLLLGGCQYSGVVECADGCTVNVHDTEQNRGGQSDLGVEAAVDAKDNVIEGIPGL